MSGYRGFSETDRNNLKTNLPNRYIMRRVFSCLLVSMLSIYAYAQGGADYFDLVEEVFSSEFSLTDFKARYQDHITEVDESDEGKITLKDVALAGFKCTAGFSYFSDSNMKLLVAMPEYNSFSKSDQYLYAMKCHSFMIDRFGAPDKAEQESPDHPNVTEATTYTWQQESGIKIQATYSKTRRFDLYMVVVSRLPSNSTNTVQRKFFKTLELGKALTRPDIALALGTSTTYISATDISSGIQYTYFRPIHFGGIEWTVCQLETVENAMSSIMFTNISKYDNREVFKRISAALTQKYGVPEVDTDQESWFDGRTMVTLMYQYGLAKSGEMLHYVYLSYSDFDLHSKASDIIQSEL